MTFFLSEYGHAQSLESSGNSCDIKVLVNCKQIYNKALQGHITIHNNLVIHEQAKRTVNKSLSVPVRIANNINICYQKWLGLKVYESQYCYDYPESVL